MATDFSAFQQILEAVQRAQTMGALALLNDTTTRETDDQDCYPRGIKLSIERKDPKWYTLRFLAKHLDWVDLDSRTKHFYIASPQPIDFRLAEVTYLMAVADSLNESGIECAADVYYR